MKRALAVLLLCPGLALGCDMMAYTRVQASPHVWVFQAAEGTTGVVNGNIVAVVGKDAILVVDSGQIPSVARKVLAEIRKLSPAPIRYLVNTHWHGDHVLANFVFKDAFPQARIVAHSHTIAEGARAYTDYGPKMHASLPKVVAAMRKRSEASKDAEAKLFIERTVECAERLHPEVAGTRYVPAESPMDTELRAELGGVTAVVRHLGRGNTPGDLVVWVEQDRLVATGDIVVHPAPYAIGSDLEPWVETLGKVRALKARVIVPGHGPVMRNDTYLGHLQALFAGTARQFEEMKRDGLKSSQAPAKLDTKAFVQRYIDTPMKRQAFSQFFVDAAAQQAWKSPPKPAGRVSSP